MDTFDRKEILSVCERVTKAATKSVDPLTSKLLIREGGFSCFTGAVECNQQTDLFPGLSFVIDAKTLQDFLRRIDGDEVGWEYTGDVLKLKQGRKRAQIPVQTYDDRLVLPSNMRDKVEWFPVTLDDVFWEHVAACIKTCSGDDAPIFDNVLWSPDGEMASTDRCAVTKATVIPCPVDTAGYPIAVPKTALELAGSFGCTVVGYERETAFLYFLNEETQVLVGTVTYDNYPIEVLAYTELGEDAVNDIILPPGLDVALDRCMVFIDKKDKTAKVLVESDGNTFRLTAESDKGQLIEELRTAGPEFSFPCHPQLLKNLSEGDPYVSLDSVKIVFSFFQDSLVHAIGLE